MKTGWIDVDPWWLMISIWLAIDEDWWLLMLINDDLMMKCWLMMTMNWWWINDQFILKWWWIFELLLMMNLRWIHKRLMTNRWLLTSWKMIIVMNWWSIIDELWIVKWWWITELLMNWRWIDEWWWMIYQEWINWWSIHFQLMRGLKMNILSTNEQIDDELMVNWWSMMKDVHSWLMIYW